MARYILIDNGSGFIFADTADLPAHTFAGEDFPIIQSGITPVEAARWHDEAVVREFGRTYELLGHNPHDTSTGYHVYRADINGSDAVRAIDNGQDAELIEAVERDCEYVGFVRCHDAAE
jgi:hypothetical protein